MKDATVPVVQELERLAQLVHARAFNEPDTTTVHARFPFLVLPEVASGRLNLDATVPQLRDQDSRRHVQVPAQHLALLLNQRFRQGVKEFCEGLLEAAFWLSLIKSLRCIPV